MIDVENRRLDVDLTDAQLAERLAQWKGPALRYATGVRAKYTRPVSDASVGAVTDIPAR